MLPDNTCVIIPTFNNSGTILDVISDVLGFASRLYVICDGPTDGTDMKVRERYSGDSRVSIIGYVPNMGKGYALMKGFKAAVEDGFTYAVTLDSDGQHPAEEISSFDKAIRENPNCMVMGSRVIEGEGQSAGSRFANDFSNFWFTVQTGIKLPDTQTGYRLYPLNYVAGMHLFSRRYEAELELMVRMAWNGVRFVNIPVKVYYPPAEERVSHFRKGRDFARITVLNTVLTLIAVIYGRPSIFVNKLIGKCRK